MKPSPACFTYSSAFSLRAGPPLRHSSVEHIFRLGSSNTQMRSVKMIAHSRSFSISISTNSSCTRYASNVKSTNGLSAVTTGPVLSLSSPSSTFFSFFIIKVVWLICAPWICVVTCDIKSGRLHTLFVMSHLLVIFIGYSWNAQWWPPSPGGEVEPSLRANWFT